MKFWQEELYHNDKEYIIGPKKKGLYGVLHKIINGQPGAKMPSLRAFGMGVVADIMSYIQTLEK